MTEALRTTLDAPDARRNGTRPPVPERTYVQLRAPGAPDPRSSCGSWTQV